MFICRKKKLLQFKSVLVHRENLIKGQLVLKANFVGLNENICISFCLRSIVRVVLHFYYNSGSLLVFVRVFFTAFSFSHAETCTESFSIFRKKNH